MNTLTYTNAAFHVTARTTWIRLNRILAWGIIGAPLLQLVLGESLMRCMATDLALVVAHGVLSLVLFGMPKLKGRDWVPSMQVFGLRPSGLSPRNRFLLSGYRIALSVGMMALLFVPGAPWLVLPSGLYMMLRLPVTTIQHAHGAIVYALQRWGVRGKSHGQDDQNAAGDWASFIVLIYVSVYVLNFVLAMARPTPH